MALLTLWTQTVRPRQTWEHWTSHELLLLNAPCTCLCLLLLLNAPLTCLCLFALQEAPRVNPVPAYTNGSVDSNDIPYTAAFCSSSAKGGSVIQAFQRIKGKYMCMHIGCTTRASFGIDGSPHAQLCASHRQQGMVDVISRRCAHKACRTIPTFNLPGSTKGLFCVSQAAKHGECPVPHL